MHKSTIFTVTLLLLVALLASAIHDAYNYDAEALQFETDNAMSSLVELDAELDAEASQELEADAMAQLEAELELSAEVEAELDAEVDETAEVEADADVEAEAEEAESEAEAENEADEPAPAAAAATAPSQLPANATTANATATTTTTTPIQPVNVTIPGLGQVNTTQHPELKALDMNDTQRVMYLALHDGRQGSVKPIIPPRKGEANATKELAEIEAEKVKKQQSWEQRAADEQRTQETAEHEILKAAGMLPPPVKHVTPEIGIPNPNLPTVPAGTDLEPPKPACNTTLVTVPPPEKSLTDMLNE